MASASDRARIAELAGRFGDREGCDREALAELRALRERFGDRELLEALTVAFTACESDSAYADLLAETLPDPPDVGSQLGLAAALIRAARYEEAAQTAQPVADGGGGPTAQWLTGFAMVHAGRAEEALPYLEAGRATAGGAGGSEGPLLMGLAHLQSGRAEQAIPLLSEAVRLDPANQSATNALARALADAGRVEEAAAMAARTEQVHAMLGEREKRTQALSARASSLERAWAAGHHDAAERLIEEMWDDAPPGLRVQLQQYRVELYARTGRPDEAAAARDELARMGGQQ